MIFWQSARTTSQARPNVAVPTTRAAGRQLEILVDVHERYPWTFGHQQATTRRAKLAAGDYAVIEGEQVVAAFERKPMADLVSTMTAGKLQTGTQVKVVFLAGGLEAEGLLAELE